MTQRGQWLFVLVIVGLLAGGLAAGVMLTTAPEPASVESKAPDFAALDIASGDTIRLAAYQGDVVLLNIWATWCAPCEAEMPSMQRLHEVLGSEGLRIVAVSVDVGTSTGVKRWAEDRGLTFQILHDPSGRIERTYQTTGVPESFVIDREGIIVKKVIGPVEWDDAPQVNLLRRLLGTNDTQDVAHMGR
jgi:peroxiredoxin